MNTDPTGFVSLSKEMGALAMLYVLLLAVAPQAAIAVLWIVAASCLFYVLVRGISALAQDLRKNYKPKSPNLPAWKKISLDMNHLIPKLM